jgi:two-component system cell cycle sensor histidine kinase PleC
MIETSRNEAAKPADGPERMRRARLAMLMAGLPTTAWLNPGWAFLSIVPFMGLFPLFGYVPAWRLATVVGLHLVNSGLALAIYRSYLRNPSDVTGWYRKLTVFQALIGTSWGLLVWLLWINVVVLIPIVAVLWAYAVTRAMHYGTYSTGLGVTAILALTRFVLAPEGSGLSMAVILLLTLGCTFLLAYTVSRQVALMLQTRFANEDLTAELRRARDDALRKRYEAEAANASKTTFLANMSHELRTPLNAILGFSEIITNETFGPVGTPRYRDYARDINASGSHLLSIINDILDIAKIESGKMVIDPVPLDPLTAINNALRVLASRIRDKGQHLSVRVAPDADSVVADERAFKQILINLATNAVKFTQMGGVIIVHGLRAPDGGFELVVEDNGPGIEPSLLDSIFLPFNQVDNRYNRQEGGTGLGLSLVRGLAGLHGGRAWIETEYGAGVKAHVYFPPGDAVDAPQTAPALTA